MRRVSVCVVGPGEGATPDDVRCAYKVGNLIARKGWVLITGGRPEGVMEHASRGARAGGGLTIGVLPDDDPSNASPSADVVISTGMGSARNNILALSGSAVLACGTLEPGMLSEIFLSLKAGRPVVVIRPSEHNQLLHGLRDSGVQIVDTPRKAIRYIERIVLEGD